MKLDKNLFREILLLMEQKPDISSTAEIPLPLEKVELSERDTALPPEEKKRRQEQICWFHIRLLLEEGYIKGVLSEERTGVVFVEHLTWKGHELLDVIRDDTLWKKIKTLCTEKAMPAILSELAGNATEIVAQQIKTLWRE